MAKTLWGFGLLLPRSVSTLQLSLAFCYGSLLGWTPTLATLHSVLLLFSLIVLRVPLLWTGLIAAIAWASGAAGLDQGIHALGLTLLEAPSLQGLWTQIYNAPLLPLLRLHNSMVLGALVLSLLAFPLWVWVSLTITRRIHSSVQKGV